MNLLTENIFPSLYTCFLQRFFYGKIVKINYIGRFFVHDLGSKRTQNMRLVKIKNILYKKEECKGDKSVNSMQKSFESLNIILFFLRLYNGKKFLYKSFVLKTVIFNTIYDVKKVRYINKYGQSLRTS